MKILLLLVFVLSSAAFGQDLHSGKIAGKIVDEEKQPVPFANIILLNQKDSSLVKVVIADSTGEFAADEIKTGDYFLRVVFTGYQKFSGPVFSLNEKEYNIGEIVLEKQSTQLKEVSVTAIKPFVEHQFDKTIVNVENSIVNAGSTALEVLKRSPGVVVDPNESIRLKGKAGTIIMIDGKPSPLSSEALANMLNGMPSSAISKIEIITNPSAKYDAEGNAGVINIILKRDKQAGSNGNVNASFGEGRYEKASAGFGLNYRNTKWSLYVNYSYTHRHGFNSTMLVRNFHENGLLTNIYTLDIYASIPSDAHIPRMGADYRISKNTTIGAQLSGMANFIKPKADNITYVSDGNEVRTGSFNTISNTDNHWYNYNGNFNVRHSFDSLGRQLTADLDYSYYLNRNDQVFTTNTFDAANLLLNADVLAGNQKGLLDIYSFKTDYTHPLKENVKVEAGLKSSYVKTDNNLQYFNRIGNVDYPDSLNSNHFVYTENINSGYVNVNKEWKKFNLQLGLRVEQTLAKGVQLSNDSVFKRDYLQPFFSMAMNYKFNDRHEVGLTVSRRISRPNYQQLNPFRRYVDRTTYGAGNPFLLPALTYSTDLSYTFLESLTFTLNYSRTKDDIETAFLQNDSSKITLQSEVNIEKSESWNFAISYSKQVSSWFQTSTEFDVWQSKFSGILSGVFLDRSEPSFYFNSTNTFVLPKNYSLELSGFYQHKLIAGMLDINEAWEMGIGVQKKILNNKGVLKFNVTDLFRKNTSSGGSGFANVDSHFFALHETRVGTLSFVYNFGKAASQVKKRSGSDEEKNRVKVGG
jgi:iron complex outermembrane receptor protein